MHLCSKGVYPRTHGETSSRFPSSSVMKGLSPHTRGNRSMGIGLPSGTGSIPAHTGKPIRNGLQGNRQRVYPRTHGETAASLDGWVDEEGLSPHTRGNRKVRPVHERGIGSIPAHTGKPQGNPRLSPRSVEGLSPHTRGNRRSVGNRIDHVGSIPAHTGKPRSRLLRGLAIWVYPRTHGETAGPAPWNGSRIRSIPAHTGKPIGPPVVNSNNKVYPRTHGETNPVTWISKPRLGLSPHTRGNQLIDTGIPFTIGSIPAHTGKPSTGDGEELPGAVYPRTHGETSWRLSIGPTAWGLSPHTRGNLSDSRSWTPPSALGLSPHTRGNLRAIRRNSRLVRRDGSIPAHTGKPLPKES